MTKFTCISHVERMNNPKLKQTIKKDLCVDKVHVYAEEKFVGPDGRILTRNVEKTIDPAENMKKFKVSDFSIENLTAAGAVNNLKVCSLSGDIMVSADAAAEFLSACEAMDVANE